MTPEDVKPGVEPKDPDDDEGEDPDAKPVEGGDGGKPGSSVQPALAVSETDVQDAVTSYLQRAFSAAQADQAEEELKTLASEGKYDEIGRRFIEQQKTARTRESVAKEVRQGEDKKKYTHLFSQPELKDFAKLPADERDALQPSKFSSDAEYIVALNEYVAQKRAMSKVDGLAEEKARQKIEAEQNKNLAKKAQQGSIGAIPGGQATDGKGNLKTSSDFIAAGLREAYAASRGEFGD